MKTCLTTDELTDYQYYLRIGRVLVVDLVAVFCSGELNGPHPCSSRTDPQSLEVSGCPDF